MELFQRTIVFSSLLFLLTSSFSLSYQLFSPIDNYLIDCGSTVDSIIDNRNFVSDSSSGSSSPCLTSTRSLTLRNERPLAGLPQIYNSARVFRSPSNYELKIRDRGTHMVRIHFHTFNSSRIDLIQAQFHVLINGYLVLSNFSGGYSLNPTIKEYLIWVDSEKLVINFIPVKKTNFAFVNAIEVISAPKDLVPNSAKHLTSSEKDGIVIDGLKKEAIEIMYRVNVGGPKVTPFNDTLWRTWVPDEEYMKQSVGSKRVYSSARIKYQKNGGVSREVCPDNVYNTARVIQSTNASIPKVNMTWTFPIVGKYQYIVRLHFCDIASKSIGLLYFNVYVNGYMAYRDFDVSGAVNWALASPFYADFIVDGDSCENGVLTISVGPSNGSISYAIDGMLNGVEIMKLNNSMGSLDGNFSGKLVFDNRQSGNSNFLLTLLVFVCLLVSFTGFITRRIMGTKESAGWSKLPVHVSESSLKNGNKMPASACQ